MGFEGTIKRGKNRGRIVITLECEIPSDDFGNYFPPINDAVDCLRQDVQMFKDGKINAIELVEASFVTDIKVEATK